MLPPPTKRNLLRTGVARLMLAAAMTGAVLSPACLPAAANAADEPGGGPGQRTGPFTAHCMVTTDDSEMRWRSGIDWAARLDFGGAEVRRDMIVLYEHWFASDVRATGLSITKEPDYWDRYERALRTMLDRRVPMGFDGYVCLDIEFLPTMYGQRTGGPGIYPTTAWGSKIYDDWFAYIRNNQPESIANLDTEATERSLAASFEAMAREWRVWTITKCKQLRPGTKFAFYAIPYGSRYGSYSQAGSYFRDFNDRNSWWVEVGDAVFLPCYQNRITLPPGQTPSNPDEITAEQSREFILSNVAEARRLARGTKPVFILAFSRYPTRVEARSEQLLDEHALVNMFRTPKEAGADGIVLWDHIRNESQFNELQGFLNQHVNPIWNEIVDRTPVPPGGGGDTPPGGGGGGGGDTPPGGGGGGGGDTPPGGGGGGGDTPPGGGGGGDTPPGGGGGGDTPPGGGGGGDTPPGGGGGGDLPPGGGGGASSNGGGGTGGSGSGGAGAGGSGTGGAGTGGAGAGGNGAGGDRPGGAGAGGAGTGGAGAGGVGTGGSGTGSSGSGGAGAGGIGSGGESRPEANASSGARRIGVGRAALGTKIRQPIRVLEPASRLNRSLWNARISSTPQGKKFRTTRVLVPTLPSRSTQAGVPNQ